MKVNKLAVAAVVVLTGCGGHALAKPAARPVDRVADINKSLVDTSTTGARKGAITLAVTTTRSQGWVQVSGACTGGGELSLTLHLPPAKTEPMLFICDSHGTDTDVYIRQFLPDNGVTGRAFVTVSPSRGQTWWMGIGITNAPIGGVDKYAHP